MFRKILVPVDLAHTDKISKALNIAIDLAKNYGATLCYVTVAATTPSGAAHTPEELRDKLENFAREQGRLHGIDTETRVLLTADTAVELDDRLLEAIKDTGTDLVVMASHPQGIADRLHILRSNGANIVRHSEISVFVVR